jgi:hypothetical protein
MNMYVYCLAVLVHTVAHCVVLCVHCGTCSSACTTMYMYNLNCSRWQHDNGAAVWINTGSRVAPSLLG